MRIAIISSSNGGAFKAFFKMRNLKAENIIVITDRTCGTEEFSVKNNIKHCRVNTNNNNEFSTNSKELIDSFGGVDFVFLFYTRLVTSELFNFYPTFNFHPSLLPAFRGFSPISKAINEEVKFFGTTLHAVNEFADNGRILAQSVYPVNKQDTEDDLEKISFFQKVYFMCLCEEHHKNQCVHFNQGHIEFRSDKIGIGYFNPSIQNPEMINQLQKLAIQNKINIL